MDNIVVPIPNNSSSNKNRDKKIPLCMRTKQGILYCIFCRNEPISVDRPVSNNIESRCSSSRKIETGVFMKPFRILCKICNFRPLFIL